MKKWTPFLSSIALVLLAACTAPEGPAGRDGRDGLNGLLGTTYENVSGYNFTATNGYSNTFFFPKPILESDVVLVYRLIGVDKGKDNWRSLPETYFFDNGTRNFTYNFDFTKTDVLIKLFGSNLNTVDDKDRLGQIFRIVVIPSNFPSSINKKSYTDVMAALNKDNSTMPKVGL